MAANTCCCSNSAGSPSFCLGHLLSELREDACQHGEQLARGSVRRKRRSQVVAHQVRVDAQQRLQPQQHPAGLTHLLGGWRHTELVSSTPQTESLWTRSVLTDLYYSTVTG